MLPSLVSMSPPPPPARLPVGQGVAPGRRAPVPERRRQDLDATPGSADRVVRPPREGVGPDPNRPGELAAPSDLDQRPLAGQASLHQRRWVDLVAAEGLDVVQVDRGVGDPERVLEPPELGDPLHEGELAPLEPERHGVPGPLALAAPAGGLAALAGDPPADPAAPPSGPRRRGNLVELHGWASSTSIRWGTRASMPRISGRSGSSFTWPIPRSPRARRVPRCLGLEPMAERTWRTRRVRAAGAWARCSGISGSFPVELPLPPALPVGAQHASGDHLVGGLAPQLGDLIRPAQLLQAGDGRVGHVDPVGGAERLGQDISDPGHLQNVAGRTAGDDAGPGGGRLQHDPAGTALPDD